MDAARVTLGAATGPGASASGRAYPVPPNLWAPPVGPPAVADLATNRPGVQLEAQVQLAHEAGQRPTPNSLLSAMRGLQIVRFRATNVRYHIISGLTTAYQSLVT